MYVETGHSRLAYTESLTDVIRPVLYLFPDPGCRLVFKRHGVTINLVMADNGSSDRSHLLFLAACHRLVAMRIKPKS